MQLLRSSPRPGPWTGLCCALALGACGGPPTSPPTQSLSRLELSPAEPGPLPVGHSVTFTAAGIRANGSREELGTATALAWSSSNPGVATVADGVVTGVAPGTTTIAAELDDASGEAITGAVPVVVSDAVVTSIAVQAAGATLPVGFAQRCRASATFSDGGMRDITFDSGTAWTSSPVGVVEVGTSGALKGQVRALTDGLATITATSGGVDGNLTVTVTRATLVGITVAPAASGCEPIFDPSGAGLPLFTCAAPVTVEVGTTVAFTATAAFSDGTTLDLTDAVAWESSDASVLRVSNLEGSSGVGTGVRLGPPAPLDGSLVAVTATLDLVLGQTWVQVANPRTLEALFTFGATPTCEHAVSDVLTQLGARRQEWIRGCLFSDPPDTCVRDQADAFLGGFAAELAAEPSCTTVPAGLSARAYAVGRYSDGVNFDAYEDLTSTVTWNDSNAIVGAVAQDGTITGLAPGGLSVTASAPPIAVSPTLSFQVTACPFDPAATFLDGQTGVLVVPANVTAAAFAAAGDARWLNELSPALASGTYLPSGLRAPFAALARLQTSAGDNPDCELPAGSGRFDALGGGILYDVGARATWTVSNETFATVDASGNVTAGSELELEPTDVGPGFGSPGPSDAPYETTLMATFDDPGSGASFSSSLDLVIEPPCIDGVTLTNSLDAAGNDLQVPAGVPFEVQALMHLSSGDTLEQAARDGVPAPPDAPYGHDSLTTWSASDGACLHGVGDDTSGDSFTYSAADPARAGFAAAYAMTGACPGETLTLTATAAVPSPDANPFSTACRTSDRPRASARVEVTFAVLDALVVTPGAPQVPAGRRVPLVATGTFDDGAAFDLTRASSWSLLNNDAAATLVSSVSADPLLGLVDAGGTQGSALVTATHDRSDVQRSGSALLTVGPGATVEVVVQLYQAALAGPENCFDRDTSDGLPAADFLPPSPAWTEQSSVPATFTTWVRVLAHNGEWPYLWADVTGSSSISVLDPDGTGTTVDVDGRVVAGAVPGTVHVLAENQGVDSDPWASGLLQVEPGTLARVTINPGAVVDPGDPQFGPNPVFVALGARAPAKLTGTFATAFGDTYYCVTSEALWSSSATLRARVDADGWISGDSEMGSVTVTARVGTSIADTVTVNVGPAELARIDISPNGYFPLANNVQAQLAAAAILTDGTQLIISQGPQTAWVAVLPAYVTATGIAYVIGLAGEVGQVQACYTSDFIDPAGSPYSEQRCSPPLYLLVQ